MKAFEVQIWPSGRMLSMPGVEKCSGQSNNRGASAVSLNDTLGRMSTKVSRDISWTFLYKIIPQKAFKKLFFVK